MKKYIPYLKNKFILTSVIFIFFILFLDEFDIFTVVSNNAKLIDLKDKKKDMLLELDKTQSTLDRLKFPSEVERFAREEKFFKKDDEDIFVVFEE